MLLFLKFLTISLFVILTKIMILNWGIASLLNYITQFWIAASTSADTITFFKITHRLASRVLLCLFF